MERLFHDDYENLKGKGRRQRLFLSRTKSEWGEFLLTLFSDDSQICRDG